jgi:uncharacterized protein YjbI with pentapeptide repeats
MNKVASQVIPKGATTLSRTTLKGTNERHSILLNVIPLSVILIGVILRVSFRCLPSVIFVKVSLQSVILVKVILLSVILVKVMLLSVILVNTILLSVILANATLQTSF